MIRIPFAGALSESEFLRMQALGSPMNFRRIGWLLLVFVVLVLLAGGYETVIADPLVQAPKLLFFLLPALVLILGMPWAVRRQWKKSEILSAPINGGADEAGIEWNSPFVAARFPWDKFQKAVLSDDLVLLYIAAFSVLYFPRRFFVNDEAWEAFAAAVRSRVKTRK
jgi:hypothetical protein